MRRKLCKNENARGCMKTRGNRCKIATVNRIQINYFCVQGLKRTPITLDTRSIPNCYRWEAKKRLLYGNCRVSVITR